MIFEIIPIVIKISINVRFNVFKQIIFNRATTIPKGKNYIFVNFLYNH